MKISPKNKNIYNNLLTTIENLKKINILNSCLGNRGYSIYKISLTPEIIDFIKKELTVSPFSINNYGDTKTYPVYMESDKKIYVPRFWGINLFGNPKEIKISKGLNINLIFKGVLRKDPIDQELIIDKYLHEINFNKNLSIEENDNLNNGKSSALIELKTGGGKTVLGLKISSIIQKKTITFVNKTFLKDQWIERINQFLPNAKIGTIQGQIIDIENKDIVIAMLQSISMKEYPQNMFNDFGFSIYDEVHHLSSEVFGNCLKKCNTLYSLGLSATMERKDGLSHVFKMFLGNICDINIDLKKINDDVLVKVINYNIKDDDDFIETEFDFKGNPKYSTMINKLANYNYRNDFIVNVIHNEFKINNNQQMMVLCHTRDMLQYIFNKINENQLLTVGFYVGGMKKEELKKSESKQIILGTYQMAAEGLDIKSLSCLFLATPKTDIVQAVGRILREKHENPFVIDLVDVHNCFQNQFLKRKIFYNKQNYKIIKTTNEKYIEYIRKINKEKNYDINSNYNDIWEKIYKNKKLNKKESSDILLAKKCLI